MLKEYRTKVINKIIFAGSQEEIKECIHTSIRSLEENNAEQPDISLFVKRMISDLESFSPMNEEAEQWSNIKVAKVLFNRIRNQSKEKDR